MERMKAFVFWVGVVVFVVFTATAAAGVSSPGDARRGKSSTVASGRSVYAANCARCHGSAGTGHTTMGEMTQARDLTDAAWQSRRSTARMTASVTNGRGEMPAFKRRLSRQEIAAAVAYVRTLKR